MWDLRLTEAETRAVLDALERMASVHPAAFETKLLGPVRSRLSARVAVWDANTARRAHREIAAMADEIEPETGPDDEEEAGPDFIAAVGVRRAPETYDGWVVETDETFIATVEPRPPRPVLLPAVEPDGADG